MMSETLQQVNYYAPEVVNDPNAWEQFFRDMEAIFTYVLTDEEFNHFWDHVLDVGREHLSPAELAILERDDELTGRRLLEETVLDGLDFNHIWAHAYRAKVFVERLRQARDMVNGLN